ncbi:MAG: hypothetical protein AABM29_01820 [Actinomycetota bacterium]
MPKNTMHVTAPLSQRLRCAITGHDWRRAIAPREGHYLRCRRCWTNRFEESPQQRTTASAGSQRSA